MEITKGKKKNINVSKSFYLSIYLSLQTFANIIGIMKI